MRRLRPLLGTYVEVRVDDGAPSHALRRAFDAIESVHRLMSRQDPASDVCRINGARPGESVPIDLLTRRVLEQAWRISEATGGLFDCCAGCGSLADVELLDASVRLRRSVRLTLDGIAKGFAVDEAVRALRSAGVARGVVNAGGDMSVFGMSPEPVHVRDPGNLTRLVLIGWLSEGAVATSGQYLPKGAIGASIVDPRTGKRCRSRSSVSVVAQDCITADALTKAVMLDARAATQALRRLGARAVVLPGKNLERERGCAAS